MSNQIPLETNSEEKRYAIGDDGASLLSIQRPWLVGLTAVGVLIAVLLASVVGLLLRDDARPASGSAVGSDAETFTASGSLELIGSVTGGNSTQCAGEGGYSDISVGTQVVVRGADGTILGTGSLGSSFLPEKFEGLGDVACAWTFAVEDVASGSRAYTIEVSHRGEVTFTEEAADFIVLTLGS